MYEFQLLTIFSICILFTAVASSNDCIGPGNTVIPLNDVKGKLAGTDWYFCLGDNGKSPRLIKITNYICRGKDLTPYELGAKWADSETAYTCEINVTSFSAQPVAKGCYLRDGVKDYTLPVGFISLASDNVFRQCRIRGSVYWLYVFPAWANCTVNGIVYRLKDEFVENNVRSQCWADASSNIYVKSLGCISDTGVNVDWKGYFEASATHIYQCIWVSSKYVWHLLTENERLLYYTPRTPIPATPTTPTIRPTAPDICSSERYQITQLGAQLQECNSTRIREQNRCTVERDLLTSEQNRLKSERDRLISERDRCTSERGHLQSEIDRLNAAATSFNCRDVQTPGQTDGNGNVVYLDRHHVFCNANEALSGFRLVRPTGNTVSYSYKCCRIAATTFNCRDGQTPGDLDGNGNSQYLDRQRVFCNADEALSGFRLVRPTGNTLSYSYKCCQIAATTFTCRDGQTPGDFDGNGANVYLDRQHVFCQTDEALAGFRLVRPTGNTFSYNFSASHRQHSSTRSAVDRIVIAGAAGVNLTAEMVGYAKTWASSSPIPSRNELQTIPKDLHEPSQPIPNSANTNCHMQQKPNYQHS